MYRAPAPPYPHPQESPEFLLWSQVVSIAKSRDGRPEDPQRSLSPTPSLFRQGNRPQEGKEVTQEALPGGSKAFPPWFLRAGTGAG